MYLHQTSTARYATRAALRRERKTMRKEQRYKGNKMAKNKHLSIIILSVNGLKFPSKDIG